MLLIFQLHSVDVKKNLFLLINYNKVIKDESNKMLSAHVIKCFCPYKQLKFGIICFQNVTKCHSLTNFKKLDQ